MSAWQAIGVGVFILTGVLITNGDPSILDGISQHLSNIPIYTPSECP